MMETLIYDISPLTFAVLSKRNWREVQCINVLLDRYVIWAYQHK